MRSKQIGLALALVLLATGCVRIDSGRAGVLWTFFGGTQDDVIFGQQGIDVLQGDGATETVLGDGSTVLTAVTALRCVFSVTRRTRCSPRSSCVTASYTKPVLDATFVSASISAR